MQPTHERLGADNLPRAYLDLRLEEGLELATQQATGNLFGTEHYGRRKVPAHDTPEAACFHSASVR
jgi:hypothetical protein